MMSEEKKQLLFVDDESRILEGIKRALHPMHEEWDMAFSTDAEEALKLVHEKPPDIVVSDLRMPGMSGTEFLRRLQKYYPSCVRIVLSGHADRDDVMALTGCVHQFLSKPISSKVLRRVLGRAARMSNLLGDVDMREIITKLEALPTQPSIYRELMLEIESPSSTAKSIGEIVAHDAAVSSKLLQLVNSSFFTLGQDVTSIEQAVNLLGLETLKALALNESLLEMFKNTDIDQQMADDLWVHMQSVAVVAGKIVQDLTDDRQMHETAFAGGLLHDIGRLIIMTEMHDAYKRAEAYAIENHVNISKAELEVLGSSHAEMGAYLLGLWGLPDSLVDCALYHHRVGNYTQDHADALIAVNIANGLVDEMVPSHIRVAPLDKDIVEKKQLGQYMAQWRKFTQSTVSKVEA